MHSLFRWRRPWLIWPRTVPGIVILLCTVLAGAASAADKTAYDQTIRYVLEVVGAFRAAYVLHVVEHTKGGGVTPNEEWENNPHLLPLPAQFVKAAASEVRGLEIGLVSMTPLNKLNLPKTTAESEALIKLSGQRDQRVITFSDGDYIKGIAADLAIVQSCVDCHNTHPRALRRNFQRWDLMGGIIVRLKPTALEGGLQLGPQTPDRPGSSDRPLSPSFTPPPWLP